VGTDFERNTPRAAGEACGLNSDAGGCALLGSGQKSKSTGLKGEPSHCTRAQSCSESPGQNKCKELAADRWLTYWPFTVTMRF
jgi:hypothetical protein